MGFNMKGFNPGRGTGMSSPSQPSSQQVDSSPFTKKGPGDKKKPPRKGETHDTWKRRNGLPLGIVPDLRIWDGKKWIKGKADISTKIKNTIEDVKDVVKSLVK